MKTPILDTILRQFTKDGDSMDDLREKIINEITEGVSPEEVEKSVYLVRSNYDGHGVQVMCRDQVIVDLNIAAKVIHVDVGLFNEIVESPNVVFEVDSIDVDDITISLDVNGLLREVDEELGEESILFDMYNGIPTADNAIHFPRLAGSEITRFREME